MKTRTDLSIQEFGAGILLNNLSALESEFEGVRKGEDIEAIHRMRVASRRLRAALPLFGPVIAPKKHIEWIRHIGWLTKALGAARLAPRSGTPRHPPAAAAAAPAASKVAG